MGLAMDGVALVEAMEMAQQLAAQCQVLRVGQDCAAETAARHLLQLVHPHIAAGADVAAYGGIRAAHGRAYRRADR